MKGEELKKVWEKFTEKNDFMLNPDKNHVDMVIGGLLENGKKYGLMLCPCRLRDGTRETDISLICPCNFKAQENWKTRGECWCGLFVKR